MHPSAEQIVAMILFTIPWLIALYQLYQGITQGKMREFRKNETKDDLPVRYCFRAKEPKTFWCLFAFYLLIVVLVPVGMIYAMTHPPTEPPTNPSSSSH